MPCKWQSVMTTRSWSLQKTRSVTRKQQKMPHLLRQEGTTINVLINIDRSTLLDYFSLWICSNDILSPPRLRLFWHSRFLDKVVLQWRHLLRCKKLRVTTRFAAVTAMASSVNDESALRGFQSGCSRSRCHLGRYSLFRHCLVGYASSDRNPDCLVLGVYRSLPNGASI